MKARVLTALGIGLLYAQVSAAAQSTATTTAPAVPQSTTTTTSVTVTTPAPAAAPKALTLQPANAPTNNPNGLNTEKDRVSYSIGADLGQSFKSQGIDVDPAMLARGLKDALGNTAPIMSPQQMALTLITFQKELIAKHQAAFDTASQKNAADGAAFLMANKTKPGIVTTPSGLQYKVITPGKGANPTGEDVVTVDYTGSFLNGKVFDSSYQHGKPVTFQVSEVIPGWTEALKLMKPGANFEVFIPYNLAYGDHGLGNVIGPKETLLFKIHLISVKSAASAAITPTAAIQPAASTVQAH